jgi:hypothetical protein
LTENDFDSTIVEVKIGAAIVEKRDLNLVRHTRVTVTRGEGLHHNSMSAGQSTAHINISRKELFRRESTVPGRRIVSDQLVMPRRAAGDSDGENEENEENGASGEDGEDVENVEGRFHHQYVSDMTGRGECTKQKYGGVTAGETRATVHLLRITCGARL